MIDYVSNRLISRSGTIAEVSKAILSEKLKGEEHSKKYILTYTFMLFSNLKHFLLHHLSVLISENLVNRLLDSTVACLDLAFKSILRVLSHNNFLLLRLRIGLPWWLRW